MKSLPRLLAFFAFVVASASSVPAGAGSRPNIIFILADDLGYGDVGVFGQNARAAAGLPAFGTPHLDRLAHDGARLTHHYCAAPVCAPSRASLLLGVSQGHAGVRNNQFDRALEDNHTLASVLRAAGYATAAFGKWGLQGDDEGGWSAPSPQRPLGGNPDLWRGYPTRRGFDFFFGYVRHRDGHRHYPKEDGKQLWENDREMSADVAGGYTTDLFTARAKRWIVDHRRDHPDRPFFVYLAHDTPHAILQKPPGPYPAGGGLRGGLQWTGVPGAVLNTSAESRPDTWLYPEDEDARHDHDGDPATPSVPWPDVQQRYASSVRRIDDGLGDLRTLLHDLGIERDTLVVFTSDNGPSAESYLPEDFSPEFFAGFGPFDGIKRDLLEGGWRVPTIAAWPAGIPAGREVSDPGAQWDWLPTFAALAGVPAPARVDGVSLLPVLSGAGPGAPRPVIYAEFAVNGRTPPYAAFEPARRNRVRGQMQALRSGDLVGVRYDVSAPDAPFEIHDVVRDPKQLRDLAAEPKYAAWQARFQALALQSRRPDPMAPTPWDDSLIPRARFDPSAAGLRWQRHPGVFPWVPELTGRDPASEGGAAAIDASVMGSEAGATVFSGQLTIPVDGEYVFRLAAPGGAVLRLHAATVIDADFDHARGGVREGAVRLAAGVHPLRLTVRHDGAGSPALECTWSGPGFAARPLTADDFAR